MTRKIKFRIWGKIAQIMLGWEKLNEMQNLANFLLFQCFNGNPRYILMQFTGLYDKNKKMIYDGDIVKVEDEIYWVEWSDCNAGFALRGNRPDDDIYGGFFDLEIQVLGNIYENPKLLEVKND